MLIIRAPLLCHHVNQVGYCRDVITQRRRGLHGFWVCHPALVRIGLALVHALDVCRQGHPDVLRELLAALLLDEGMRATVWAFAQPEAADAPGLRAAAHDPLYDRAVVAATCRPSPVVANHAPAEVRYNVFQVLQYLAAYLSGTACVSLPTAPLPGGICLTALDDLATTERSRWEVWAEIKHGRLSVADFLVMVHEEYRYIQTDGAECAANRGAQVQSVVQVKWNAATERWYAGEFLCVCGGRGFCSGFHTLL